MTKKWQEVRNGSSNFQHPSLGEKRLGWGNAVVRAVKENDVDTRSVPFAGLTTGRIFLQKKLTGGVQLMAADGS